MDWSDIGYLCAITWGITFMLGAVLGFILMMIGKFDDDDSDEFDQEMGYWLGMCFIPVVNIIWVIYWFIKFIVDAFKHFSKKL